MVLRKIKEALSADKVDDKYEVLYYKYSQVKVENQRLKEKHAKEMKDYKIKLHKKVAEELIKLYEDIEIAKAASFKVNSNDKELQRMLMDINKADKTGKELLKTFSIEEVLPKERMYDPEIHDVAKYELAKDMQKGVLLKTVKKGFKFRGDYIKKPRVVVTK